MLGFYTALKKDIALQESLLKKYRQVLRHAPPGCLTFRTAKGKIYYAQLVRAFDPESGRRLCTQRSLNPSKRPADAKLLSALAEKAYAHRMIRTLQQNLKLQKKLETLYCSYRFEEISRRLGKTYQGLPLQHLPNLCASQSQEIAKKQAEACRHAIHPEALTQPTLAGFKVRSKSETIICNLLTERRISFVYEESLRFYIPGEGYVTLHPDFVIYLPDGRIVIWEHLGLLQDEKYLAAFAKKLQHYHRAGFSVGSTLFLTSDTADGQLDMQAVLHVIECLKSMGA